MFDRTDFVVITKDEFSRMIRIEDRVACLKRLLDAGEYVPESKLRAILGIEVEVPEVEK